jgi:hypothetical protein
VRQCVQLMLMCCVESKPLDVIDVPSFRALISTDEFKTSAFGTRNKDDNGVKIEVR